MNLAGRIARLERSPALQLPPQPCAGCGHYPHGQGPPTYRLEFAGDAEPGPARCGACGRQLVYCIEFDRAG